MSQNIDDFNRGCALIMAHLYQAFPRPVVLDVETLDSCTDTRPDERAARLEARREIYVATVQFLTDEGYLVQRGHDEWSSFAGVRLTSKGLAALNKTPAALTPAQKTLGDRLLGLTADLADSASKEGVKLAIASLLG